MGHYQNLARAKKLRETSPTEAIKLLESVVLQSQRSKDRRVSGEAYELLGEIFEDIDQKELAIQRYEEALNTLSSKQDQEKKAVLYQRIGRLQIALKKAKKASVSFLSCLDLSKDKKLIIKCKEGLADVALLNKRPEESLKIIDSVANNYSMDSLENARVEARRSQSYLQQNDYSRASKSFYNSIGNLPRNQQVDEADYAPIQQAQTDLLNYNKSNVAEEITIRSNTANYSAPNAVSNDIMVKENLKIAELYEKDNKLDEAEKFIAISKKVITPKTNAAAAAAVYKKSSELNKRQGKIEAALDDLEAYITAKEKSISDLEGNLKQQVEIVKGQKDIDVGQREYILEEKEGELIQSQLRTQQIIIGLLSVLLIASGVFFYFLYKNVKDKRKANQKLLLKSLRTQMNPHFIFNALNSVNNFIAKNDEKAANKFLADFSRLMRKVLDFSQHDFISFEEEIELNQLYLKLEHFRFRDQFDYEFDNQLQQNTYELEIPPMLIQPFIENAVWHGLRYKESKGNLLVRVKKVGQQLHICIEDDGIGREKSKALKTANQRKYKSTGLENVAKRVQVINELYGKQYEISVKDKDEKAEDKGTVVEIRIPL